MTRDELLLAALLAGETTTAALVPLTGLKERNCRYGLRHLMAAGYAWSPARGRWRLTAAGRAIAMALPELPPAGEREVQSIAHPADGGETASTDEAAGFSSAPVASGMPAWLGWALTGLGAAGALLIALRWPNSPPLAPPPAPPIVWPYDGWRIGPS